MSYNLSSYFLENHNIVLTEQELEDVKTALAPEMKEESSNSTRSIIASTIPDAQFKILRFIDRNGYRQDIDRGEFEGENVYRMQCEPILVTITKPQDMFDKPNSVSIYQIEDYVQNLLTPVQKVPADYTYGSRMGGQIMPVVEMLKETPNTNQAIIEIGQPSDIHLKHMPCFRLIHFMKYKGRLNMSLFTRSNDIKEAFLLNLYGFSALHSIISEMVEIDMGEITYFSSGSHYYVFNDN